MEWLLPILLLTALLLSVGLSVWQTKRYTSDINRIALTHNAPGRHLVSGRGKGRTRGAVAVLVVDSTTDEVVAASAMAGASVFARLRPMPALAGPVATVTERTDDPHIRRAIEDALDRLKNLRGSASDTALTTTPPLARSTTEQPTKAPTGRTRIRVSRPTAATSSAQPRTGVAPGPDNPRS